MTTTSEKVKSDSLADLVLVVTEGTVERGEFTQLVPFVVILAFRNRCGLQDGGGG